MRSSPTTLASSPPSPPRTPFAILALLVLLVLLAAPLAAWGDELNEADLLLRAGRPVQALERVDEYLAKKPGDMQARFLKGVILAEASRDNEAIDVFVRLTQDNPEYAEPYNNLAVLYASRGNLERARIALESAVRVNPKFVTAQENLGDVYARLAVAAYGRAAALDTGSRAAREKLKLSRALVAVGKGEPGAPANR